MTPPYPATAVACRRIACALSFVAASALLHAQSNTAPTPAELAKYDLNKNGVLDADELSAMHAAEGAKSDTVTLTPFQVTTDKDNGYAAANTLSGGRADTPLKITPNSVSVMTKQFLDDFNITDMNAAAAWTIGMDAPTGGETGPFGGNRFQASFRGGDAGANFPQRDGALQYFIADSYNSERFEFSRGPSTALFGDGGPGGLQGSTSKQARLNSTQSSVSFRVDSYNAFRATLDTNYGNDRFALRANLLYQNIKAFQDGTSNKQRAISVAGTYKIAQNTQFRFEFEKSAEHNLQYRKTYGEQASIWNGTTVNADNSALLGNVSASLAAAGIQQISATTDYLAYNFGTNTLLNYKGNQYRTVGLGYQIPWEGRPDLPNFQRGFGRRFNLGPADVIADRDFNAHSFFIEHRFSADWSAQIAFIGSDGDPIQRNMAGGNMPSDYRIDVNRLLPNGLVNTNFGQAFSDSGVQNIQYQQDDVREYRGTTSYKFEVPKWFDLKERLSLNTGWRQGIFEMAEYNWQWMNNPLQTNAQNGANSLRYRIYYNNPRPAISPVRPPTAAGYTFKEIRSSSTGNQARRSRTLSYGQLISQTSFFDEKLALTGSIRRDKITLRSVQAVSFDSNYDPVIGFGGVAGATGLRTVWQTSKSAGVVTYPFPNKYPLLAPLGFVGNYSSNFQQISNSTTPLISGEQPPLTQGVTNEFGLRYSLGDGRVYLTVSHYNTKQINVLSGWGTQSDFRNMYLNLGYPNDGAIIGPNGFNFQDISNRKLEGWEVELTANPSRNLTFTMNYSHPITTTISESEQRRAFYAAHLAEYKAGAAAVTGQVVNGRAILDPAVIATSMLNIENNFNGFTPGTLGNVERHRINVSGRYAFTDGELKGLAFIAGVRYRGHKKIGSRDARLKFQTTAPTQDQTNAAAYDYLWTDSIYSVSAGANYTRRFGKYTARFQLNIENLLDDKVPQWTSYSVIQAGQLNGVGNANNLTAAGSNARQQVLSGFNLPDPRKITLSTTLSF